MNARSEQPAARADCPECGGALVEGNVTLPLLGPPRFAYRLGSTEVATEVAASMCQECGLVRFHATDVERIRRAVNAAGRSASSSTGSRASMGGSSPPAGRSLRSWWPPRKE